MRRTHRLPAKLIRWASLCVSFALILASLTLITPISSGSGFMPQGRNEQPNNGKGKKVAPVPPLPGAPAASLPSLDETRQRQNIAPQARSHVPSTSRSRRKPLESRHGLKVGDRLPPAIKRAAKDLGGVKGGTVLSHHAVGSRNSSPANPSILSSAANRARYLPEPLLMAPQGSANTQNVVWTNVVGASASGNNLTKTSGDGWNGGAVSTQSIVSGDGYVETTVSETNTDRMIGLSYGDADQNYADIDFAMYPSGTGSGSHVYVYESGVYRGVFGPYAIGDHLRVAVESGVVKYSRNGMVFYTSTVAPSYPLLVDTSLYSNGSTVSDVVISESLGGGTFSDQYTENFVYWALNRQPTNDEVNY